MSIHERGNRSTEGVDSLPCFANTDVRHTHGADRHIYVMAFPTYPRKRHINWGLLRQPQLQYVWQGLGKTALWSLNNLIC